MTKIVYNACHGGFGLSDVAIKLYAQIAGSPLKRNIISGIHYLVKDGDYFSHRDIDRSDPVLVRVVEKLGVEANGDCAELAIRELPAGTLYRIHEHAGNERIITQDEQTWVVA